MRRRTKTLLTTSNKPLQPKTIHPKAVQNELTKKNIQAEILLRWTYKASQRIF